MTIRNTIRSAGQIVGPIIGRIIGPISRLAALAVVAPAVLAIAAHAQTAAPSPAPQTTQAQPAAPAASGAVKISPPMAKDATAGASVKDVVIGSTVIGSDGQKIGEVKGVKSDPSGMIEEIHVKTGGVLGFGGKVVIIPAAKISKGGPQSVQVALTAADIGKLPPVADKKG